MARPCLEYSLKVTSPDAIRDGTEFFGFNPEPLKNKIILLNKYSLIAEHTLMRFVK
jgi:hypothetical protein